MAIFTKRFEELYDAKLRNQLGNMLNRLLVLITKEGGSLADIPSSAASELTDHLKWQEYATAMNAFEPQRARSGYKLVNQVQSLHRSESNPEGRDPAAKLDSHSSPRDCHISLMLLPFMPETAQKIAAVTCFYAS